jgi:hypothetical protein
MHHGAGLSEMAGTSPAMTRHGWWMHRFEIAVVNQECSIQLRSVMPAKAGTQ